MRGAGQIAELTAIAEPDVGVIVNVGPAHLELLGSLEAIAAAKAELIAGLAPGAARSCPPASRCSRRTCARTCARSRSASGGDVTLARASRRRRACVIAPTASEIELRPSFAQAHNLRNLLAAVAAARALGAHAARAGCEVRFSAMRGAARWSCAGGVVADRRLLQRQPDVHARGDRRPRRDARRRGAWRCSATCSSWGRRRRACTARSARTRRERGVELLVTVGPLAAEMRGAFDGRGPRGGRRARRPPSCCRAAARRATRCS